MNAIPALGEEPEAPAAPCGKATKKARPTTHGSLALGGYLRGSFVLSNRPRKGRSRLGLKLFKLLKKKEALSASIRVL